MYEVARRSSDGLWRVGADACTFHVAAVRCSSVVLTQSAKVDKSRKASHGCTTL